VHAVDGTLLTRKYHPQISYVTSHVGGERDPMPLFEQAVEMLAAGRIELEPLITHVFSYRDFPAAFEKSSNYEGGVIKTLIKWTDEEAKL
jgi:threonine dehydrogenase-like Zn-dependent dehydrogenase